MMEFKLKNPKKYKFEYMGSNGDDIKPVPIISAKITKSNVLNEYESFGYDIVIILDRFDFTYKHGVALERLYDWSDSISGCKQIFASRCGHGSKWIKQT